MLKSFTKWHGHKKMYSIIHLLSCGTNYIIATLVVSFFVLKFVIIFFHFLCDKLEVVVIMGSIIELWVNHYLQSKENGCGKPMYLCKLVWIKKMMDLISVYSIINITSGISAMMDLRSLILKFHFPNVTSPLNYPSPINFWVIFFSWNPWSFQRNKAHKEQVFPFAQSISTNSPILYYLCLDYKLMHA